MKWYIIILLTICVHSAIGTILGVCSKDKWLEYWGIGIIGFILWILLYPVRAWRTYSNSVGYYKKKGISRLQFLLGKRVRVKYFDDDDEE